MRLSEKLRVKPGKKIRLADLPTDITPGYKEKPDVGAILAETAAKMADLQYLMYAENKRSLLIVLQAMDTGGKDGTIRHVMTGLNPAGVHVTSFKVPSDEERDHDFLWRIHKALPTYGDFGIFNRSHYEDVVVVRVHDLVPPAVWKSRYEQINTFERALVENDITILKFFLHISKDEQKERLQERIKDPKKQWKLSAADFAERKHWDEYQEAYEDALNKCSTEWAPWFVIPADRKWFRNLAVAEIMLETLQSMKMKYPKPTVDPSSLKLR
ncbi:MAG TPA: polyphosphate kinase 2 family protein [Candidatus Polarisedimenticolia bacterium]|nr:polyphosphate kinase 2 family protein [Candidatus Polarisedimenticolia bacterium]